MSELFILTLTPKLPLQARLHCVPAAPQLPRLIVARTVSPPGVKGHVGEDFRFYVSSESGRKLDTALPQE